jgi:hypothetical protein
VRSRRVDSVTPLGGEFLAAASSLLVMWVEGRSCEDAGVSEQALARARAGDEDAFRELTGGYRRELQLHIYRIVGSTQDAEDVLQETLLAACARWGSSWGARRCVPGCTGSPATARWMPVDRNGPGGAGEGRSTARRSFPTRRSGTGAVWESAPRGSAVLQQRLR